MSESGDSTSLSDTEREILQVAQENPAFSIAGIAEATGYRVPLVRDTIAAHDGDELATTDAESSPDGKPVDSASFNDTEAAVLEAALRNPEATNADIAATVGTTVGLVRDIRQQYEDVATLPDGTQSSASSGDTQSAESGTTQSALSDAQADILSAAEAHPEATNAEIAAQTDSRLALVRDTLAAHGDEITAEQGQPADGSTPVDSASFNETESAVLEAALRAPEATNADIAARVGTHVGLVRDIRTQYEDQATLPAGVADDAPEPAASSESSAGGMEFDTQLLSAAQEEILDCAREHPGLTNAAIAARTGHRLPLVRDTRAEHGDQQGGGHSQGSDAVKPTDSASFNDTEAAVLEAALRNPAATNATIAEEVGVHVGLVRDIRQQYEDDATLAAEADGAEATDNSAPESDIDGDTDELSGTQQAIIDTAAANPGDTHAEIAEAVDARLPLVRDTLSEHGDSDEAHTATDSADTAGTDEQPATDADSEIERQIIELATENPELTNAEIADRTGARVALVRDTREKHDISLAV